MKEHITLKQIWQDFEGFFTSNQIEKDVEAAIKYSKTAETYVTEFIASGYLPTAVVDLMKKFEVYDQMVVEYGQPVMDLLLNAVPGSSLVKLLVGQAVAFIVEKLNGISTTQANIASNTAYMNTESPATAAVVNKA